MKIAFITGSLGVGGAEKQILFLIRNLPPKVGVKLFCLSGGELEKEATGIHYELRSCNVQTGSILNKIRDLIWLIRRINSNKPDIIHSQLPLTNIYAVVVSKFLRIPIIVNELGMGITRPKWEKALRPYVFKYADWVVCNAESIKKRMVEEEKVMSSKITVILNAVGKLTPLLTRSELRKQLGIETSTSICICIASLKPVKGIDLLMRAFISVANVYEDVYLLIVGDGPLRKRYEDFAYKSDVRKRVRFLGNRSDIADLLNACDVYVSPSRAEGTSNSILEAMSLGLPVVATSVGGSKKLLDDGCGILVESEDVEGLADAINRTLTGGEKIEQQIGLATARVADGYGIDALVDSYCKVYKRIQRRY